MIALVAGIAGAAFGVVKSTVSILIWLAVGISEGGLGSNSYLHLVFGTNVISVLFCALALAGLGLAFSSSTKLGILSTLAATVAVLASVMIYVLLLPQVVPGTIGSTPNVFYYVVALAPVPALLTAVVLLSVVNRRESPI